jgi:hypothetical protein
MEPLRLVIVVLPVVVATVATAAVVVVIIVVVVAAAVVVIIVVVPAAVVVIVVVAAAVVVAVFGVVAPAVIAAAIVTRRGCRRVCGGGWRAGHLRRIGTRYEDSGLLGGGGGCRNRVGGRNGGRLGRRCLDRRLIPRVGAPDAGETCGDGADGQDSGKCDQ